MCVCVCVGVFSTHKPSERVGGWELAVGVETRVINFMVYLSHPSFQNQNRKQQQQKQKHHN